VTNEFLESNPVHWIITRSPNTWFTGRGELLSELDSIIRNALKNHVSQDPCRIVISGMGGQGKSEICLQLAQSLRKL
jgi:Mrp family chromosome partitioning ATPase